MKQLRLVALLLLLACSSSTAPGDTPRVDFASSPANYNSAKPPAGPDARGSSGRIDVTGTIVTGNPCVHLRAETVRAAQRVSITVVARQDDGICIQVVASFDYTAAATGLEPGSYEVVVSHAWEDSRGTRTSSQVVLDRTVTVP